MNHCKYIRAMTFHFHQCGNLTSVDSDEPGNPLLSLETPNNVRSVAYKQETFQIYGRFQIFLIQIIISKGVGFHLKVTKTLFLTGGVGVFRLFMACFRFIYIELSVMPEINIHKILKRLAKALIRLRICAGWSELLLVPHTTLLEISCPGSYISIFIFQTVSLPAIQRFPEENIGGYEPVWSWYGY